MARPDALSPLALFSDLFSERPPILFDIRVPDDIALEDGWVPAAHRLGFDDLEAQQAATPPDRAAVMLCQGGLKISQGAASRLTLHGRSAGYLAGGLAAWRAAGLPLSSQAPRLWVTDGADVAAHWLAKRLLPRPHEILAVAPDQVVMAADRFGGQPLPDAAGLLQRFDRPMPALEEACAFATSPEFRRLLAGGAAAFDLLDAWVRAEVAK